MKIAKNLIEVDVSLLKHVCISRLCGGLSVSNIEANEIFDQLFYAELCEKWTHGLVRLPWLLKKETRVHKKPSIQKINKFLTYFDCSDSIGYLAAAEIVSYLVEKIACNDFHIAVGKNIFPTGVLGYYIRKLLKGNIVFIFGTTPNLVKLTDGKSKVFGTNPFAAGFSYGRKKVFLVDITTAQGSFGELLAGKYGLVNFDKTKYRTADNCTPNQIDQLFDNNDLFTGSILQSLKNKSEFRQYSFMLLIQFLTTLISQNETKAGDLIFLTIKRNVFGQNSVLDGMLGNIENQITTDKIPGMHSDRLYNLNKKSKKVLIPMKLWKEICALGSP